MFTGSNIFGSGAQETKSPSILPFDGQSQQNQQPLAKGSNTTPFTLNYEEPASAQSSIPQGTPSDDKLVATPVLSKDGSLQNLSSFLKNNTLDQSAILSFLRQESMTAPDNDVQAISQNAFIQKAVHSDLNSFMNTAMTLKQLASMFDIPEDAIQLSQINIDINAKSTPFAFLKSLGIDPHLTMAKIFQLKNLVSARLADEHSENQKTDLQSTQEQTRAKEKKKEIPPQQHLLNPLGIPPQVAHQNFEKHEKSATHETFDKDPIREISNRSKANPTASTQPKVEFAQIDPRSAIDNLGQIPNTQNLTKTITDNPVVPSKNLGTTTPANSKMDSDYLQQKESIASLLRSPTDDKLANALKTAELGNSNRIDAFWNLDKESVPANTLNGLQLPSEKASLITKNLENSVITNDTETLDLSDSNISDLQEIKDPTQNTNTFAAQTASHGDKDFEEKQESRDDERQNIPVNQLHKSTSLKEFGLVENFAKNIPSDPSSRQTHELSQRIIEKTQDLSKQGGGSLVVDLPHDGPEKVSLAINVDGSNAHLKILTSSPEMKNLLSQDMDHLRQTLSTMNISLDRYEVNAVPREQLTQFFDRNPNGQQQHHHQFFDQTPSQSHGHQRIDVAPTRVATSISRLPYNISRYVPSYSRFQTAI